MDADSPYRFNIPRSFGSSPTSSLPSWRAYRECRRSPNWSRRACKASLHDRGRHRWKIPSRPAHVSQPRGILPPSRSAALEFWKMNRLRLHEGFARVERFSPDLGAGSSPGCIRWRARRNGHVPQLCFGHGDYTYTQLIFDGTSSGLVDFDTICRAEPALDLGQFLAYSRLAVLKARKESRRAIRRDYRAAM